MNLEGMLETLSKEISSNPEWKYTIEKIAYYYINSQIVEYLLTFILNVLLILAVYKGLKIICGYHEK